MPTNSQFREADALPGGPCTCQTNYKSSEHCSWVFPRAKAFIKFNSCAKAVKKKALLSFPECPKVIYCKSSLFSLPTRCKLNSALAFLLKARANQQTPHFKGFHTKLSPSPASCVAPELHPTARFH